MRANQFKNLYKKHVRTTRREKKHVIRISDSDELMSVLTYARWKNSCLHIPYKSSQKGIGDGEYRLAFLLNAEVQGPNENKDLLLSDSETMLEIKSISASSSTFLAGSTSIKAMNEICDRTNNVVRQIKQSLECDNVDVLSRCATKEELSAIKYFVDFSAKILRNSFRKYAVDDLEMVLNVIREIKKRILTFHKLSSQIDSDDNSIITSLELVKRAKIAKKYRNKRFDTFLNDADLINEMFDNPDFDNCEDFIDFISAGPKPSDVFSDVDGMMIVTKHGYIFIPKSHFDVCLNYAWTGHGMRPNFRLAFKLSES